MNSKETKRNTTNKNKKKFSLYAIASGKPGKKYSVKQFLEITNNAKTKPSGSNIDKTIKLDDGYVYHADSQQEISTLKKLISYDAFKRLRGQCCNIKYKYNGKTHDYYPDFVILTKTNKIVIMEVKEIAQMNSKVNLRKYKALERYCNQHGYLYVMCDKSFTPYSKLGKKIVKHDVDESIKKCMKKKGYFDYSDYKLLIDGKEYKKVKSIRKAIGIYVAKHNNVKMIGDLTFKSKEFKIKKISK